MKLIKKVVNLEIETITVNNVISIFNCQESDQVKIKVVGTLSYNEIKNDVKFSKLNYLHFSEDFYLNNVPESNEEVYKLAMKKICMYLRKNEIELYISAIGEDIIKDVTMDISKSRVESYTIQSINKSNLVLVDIVGKVSFVYTNEMTIATVYRSFEIEKSLLSDIDKICKEELSKYIQNTYKKGII
jgi:hypothetical protein